ncbi:outer membrane protein transport protein [Salipiger sp. P9]|uniref:OmpP1/FadL family transporter n=1 Tax=Salipiger pentaromativorans TaxID=2943193 RepID=UPI0021576335|nr:outer membrane protein transport protein [Salipiger pentaromativorans]MCR8547238.1 outer membrane protein transport protein [Salipiger pentaromativorans]
MNRSLTAAAALLLSAATAQAGGIEWMPQSAMVLYETGTVLEVTLAHAAPSLTGQNVSPPFPAQQIGNVAEPFYLPAFALKADIGARTAVALLYDRPFGADVAYAPGNLPFGGTTAKASTQALTALLKYQVTDRVSAFGGLRLQQAGGDIHMQGAAYGPLAGYTVHLAPETGLGYVLGAAYEIPEIALRVALTYNSTIRHDMETSESGPLLDPDGPGPLPALPLLDGQSNTEVKTPESWNLEFQTGIAPDTLLFGSIRYVKHSQFRVDPEQFIAVAPGGLIDLEDTTTYTLGLGRRFSERVSGGVSVTYEPAGDRLLSPLAPTTGYTQLRLLGSYKVNDRLTLSGGVSHFWLGDGMPATGMPEAARADFTDNRAWGVGVKLAYRF